MKIDFIASKIVFGGNRRAVWGILAVAFLTLGFLVIEASMVSAPSCVTSCNQNTNILNCGGNFRCFYTEAHADPGPTDNGACSVGPNIQLCNPWIVYNASCSDANMGCKEKNCGGLSGTNGQSCVVTMGKTGVWNSCSTTTKNGVWDSGRTQCIECSGTHNQGYVWGDSGQVYASQSLVFKQICGADADCDGLVGGNSCDGVGKACDSYGKCLAGATTTTTTTTSTTVPGCTDSDGGIDYYVKGMCVDISGSNTDYCISASDLSEYYCDAVIGGCNSVAYTCPSGCTNGACIGTTTTMGSTTTTIGGSTTTVTGPTTTLVASCNGEIVSVTHNAHSDQIDFTITFKNIGFTTCDYAVYAYNDGGVSGTLLDQSSWITLNPGATSSPITLSTSSNPSVSIEDIKRRYQIWLKAREGGAGRWVASIEKCCGSCAKTCPNAPCCGGCYSDCDQKLPPVMVTEIKKTVDYTVCIILRIFEGIAVVLAALMIALQGLKWMTSDDPETRKAAKYTIFHVIIALMIIIVAVQLITYLFWGMGIIEFMGCP